MPPTARRAGAAGLIIYSALKGRHSHMGSATSTENWLSPSGENKRKMGESCSCPRLSEVHLEAREVDATSVCRYTDTLRANSQVELRWERPKAEEGLRRRRALGGGGGGKRVQVPCGQTARWYAALGPAFMWFTSKLVRRMRIFCAATGAAAGAATACGVSEGSRKQMRRKSRFHS